MAFFIRKQITNMTYDGSSDKSFDIGSALHAYEEEIQRHPVIFRTALTGSALIDTIGGVFFHPNQFYEGISRKFKTRLNPMITQAGVLRDNLVDSLYKIIRK